MKIFFPASDNPSAAMSAIFMSLLQEMQQADNTIKFLPWRTYAIVKPLDASSTPPTTITQMVKYMTKLFLPKPGIPQKRSNGAEPSDRDK